MMFKIQIRDLANVSHQYEISRAKSGAAKLKY